MPNARFFIMRILCGFCKSHSGRQLPGFFPGFGDVKPLVRARPAEKPAGNQAVDVLTDGLPMCDVFKIVDHVQPVRVSAQQVQNSRVDRIQDLREALSPNSIKPGRGQLAPPIRYAASGPR